MLRRWLCAALALLALSPRAWGAGAIDSSTVLTSESGTVTSTMTVPTFTTPSGTDSHSIIGVCLGVIGLDTSYSVSAVSWNGHSFTQAASKQVTGAQPTASYWYLRNAEASTTDDITITFSESILTAVASAYVMTGLKNQAPEATATTEVSGLADLTGSINTVTRSAFVVDCLAHNQSGGFVDPTATESGQTIIPNSEVTNSNTGSPVGIGSSATGPTTPGARAMSWTDLDETSANAAQVIVSFAANLSALKDPIRQGFTPAPR